MKKRKGVRGKGKKLLQKFFPFPPPQQSKTPRSLAIGESSNSGLPDKSRRLPGAKIGVDREARPEDLEVPRGQQAFPGRPGGHAIPGVYMKNMGKTWR
ncbi:MAG: hypothetical protein JXB42_04390 [Deltaproteobacteria bacterium]|nr:hypothetical protein [Deltaproteobacteria bacterium]